MIDAEPVFALLVLVLLVVIRLNRGAIVVAATRVGVLTTGLFDVLT